MSRSRLFLGELLSSRARLRFTASPADAIFTPSAGTVNRISNEMLELPTMAQLVRPASSDSDGGRAIQGR